MSGAGVQQERKRRLLERAAEITWYHSMELAPGVVTPGEFDLRPHLAPHRLPDDLSGRRVIDVATFNGFWAFELERRGAEVVALDLSDADDLDWPAARRRPERDHALGEGFAIAHELFDSGVERVEVSVYDVTPELVGTFDLVFCGSLLIHLKNQFLALERMRALLRPGGTFVSSEPYDTMLSLLPVPVARCRAELPGAPVFWSPAIRTWAAMIRASGFSDVRRVARYTLSSPRGYSVRQVVHHASA